MRAEAVAMAQASDRSGDEVLGRLVARSASAYRLALRITCSETEAEDAVQHAYLEAVRAVRSGACGRDERTWFLGIVANAARKRLRTEARRRRREAAVGSRPGPQHPDPEMIRVLQGAMETLEDKYRVPVALCCEEGLTQQQAAAVLQAPESTISKYVRVGLERLRRALARAGYPAAAAAMLGGLREAAPAVPASLAGRVEALVAEGAVAQAPAAGGAASAAAAAAKGGIAMKLVAGVVLAGAVAGAVAVVAGGAPGGALPAAKVPGKDYPYGEGVVYRREVAFGSFASGYQDGPGPEMESFGCGRVMAPSGNWYVLDESVERVIRKYDAKKKRVYTIAWAGPLGRQGGLAECARFAGGGYHNNMGLSVDREEKHLTIFDRSNQGTYWRLDLEKGTVEPAPGADALKGARVRGQGEDGCTYFAMDDGKLQRLLADGRTVEPLGVTLEGPIHIETFFGNLAVNVQLGRLYAATRDPYSPWGVIWYWDMKTGKAHGIAGPRKGQDTKGLVLGSGPADKIRFWCGGGPGFGPDRGERYLYYAGGDESTCTRIDLEKKYVHKLVKADPKDRSLWTFGEGRQGKEYRFLDPYNWAGCPSWGPDGEFYMTWALASQVDVYRPVKR